MRMYLITNVVFNPAQLIHSQQPRFIKIMIQPKEIGKTE